MYVYICYICYHVIKTMCPPGSHHNGFVATHALGNMMYGCIICYMMHGICIYINFFLPNRQKNTKKLFTLSL